MRRWWARPGLAWVVLAAVLALGSLVMADATVAGWGWRRSGEAWRWWTAAWVHLQGAHLAANLAGALAVGAFGWAAQARAKDAVAWFLAWPATHALLSMAPAGRPDGPQPQGAAPGTDAGLSGGMEAYAGLSGGVEGYAGLSGVLHAGVAVAALGLVMRASGQRRWLGLAVLAGLGLKLVLERPWLGAAQMLPGWPFPVAVLAHLTGTLAGLICMALLSVHGSGGRNPTH
jgi:hypothetical protein